MANNHTILFCHCTYAQVIPADVKAGVLRELCKSGQQFESVADLCEMSARRDPALKKLAGCGPMKIAACYPRAVKWLFAAAEAPLDKSEVEILNQRTETAETVATGLLNSELTPNIPEDKSVPKASSS